MMILLVGLMFMAAGPNTAVMQTVFGIEMNYVL
jgi:hypothetical protein